MLWSMSSAGRDSAAIAADHAEATPMTTRSTTSTSVMAHMA